MRKRALIGLLALGILCGCNIVIAQPQPGENGDETPVGGPPVDGSAPIGGGLAILTALGIAYGVRKSLKAKEED